MTRFLRRFRLTYLTGYVLTLAITAGVAAALVQVALSLVGSLGSQEGIVVIRSEENGSGASETYMTSVAGLRSLASRTDGVFESLAGQVASAGAQAEYRVKLVSPHTGSDLEVTAVTDSFFEVVRVPVVGRVFSGEDGSQPGSVPVVLSHRLAESLGQRGGLGKQLDFGTQSAFVVGVAAAGFTGVRRGEQTDLWIPARAVAWLTAGKSRGPGPLIPIARLRPGVSVRRATDELRVIGGAVALEAVPAADLFGSSEHPSAFLHRRRLIPLLALSVIGVLLSGLVPVVTMQAARAQQRSDARAVSMALGATPRRLFLESLRDHLLIALVAVGPAAVFALGILRVLREREPIGFVELSRLLNAPSAISAVGAAGIAVLIVFLATVITGLTQNWRLGSAADRMFPKGTAHARWPARTMFAHALCTTCLLGLAGVVAIGVVRAVNVAGQSYSRAIFFEAQVRPATRQSKDAGADSALEARLQESLLEIVRLGEVETVGLGPRPLGPQRRRQLERGRTVKSRSDESSLRLAIIPVDAAYLDIIGATQIAGQPLQDRQGAASRVDEVIVNDVLATGLGVTAGDRLEVGGLNGPRTIIGVVRVPPIGSARTPVPVIFTPTDLARETMDTVVRFAIKVRSSAVAEHVIGRVERIIQSRFDGFVTISVSRGDRLLNEELAVESLAASYFLLFGVMTFVLTVWSGAWVAAFCCLAREREWGVRAALGANSWQMSSRVARLLVGPAVAGAAVGVALCLVLISPILATLGSVATKGTSLAPLAGLVVVAAVVLAVGVSVRTFFSGRSPASFLRDTA